jgi:hypothetical protein
MYEMDGRQYLLVPSSGDLPPAALPPDGAAPPNLPTGYVAFALPEGGKTSR